MKYVFKVFNNSTIKLKHSNLLYHQSETVQEFVNRSTPKTEYISIVNVEDRNLKILTNAIKNNDYVSSYNAKISEVEEIAFKKDYTGNIGLLIFMTILIISVPIVLFVISKKLKILLILFFLGGLFRLVLSDMVEIMEIKMNNNQSIIIPIRNYMGYDYDMELRKMIEELYACNSSIIFGTEYHNHNIKAMQIYNKFFIIFFCIFIITLGIVHFL